MDSLPHKVKICECWVRDGIQGESRFISTRTKIDLINRMARIGFKRIEATSFSHPKLVPQFSDALEVLRGIERPKDVTYIAIVPNEKALDRLLDACEKGYGVHEITAILSASEAHLLANLERTFEEVMPPLANVVKRARAAGLGVIGCIGTAFGCPLAGEVPLDKVIELTDWYLEQGATSIMPGDTTGEANPLQVRKFYARMKERFPGTAFIAHFHDTRGMGMANTYAALQEGVVYHDGSFGSIGGQPATQRPKYHKGYAGNTCTEDLVVMMEELGIDTGLSVPDVIELAQEIERVCGRPLYGHVTRSGPVRHRSLDEISVGALRPGLEIPPSLFFLDTELKSVAGELRDLPIRVIRQALASNWPIPDGMGLDLDQVSVTGRIEGRTILVTRFEVMESDAAREEAVLEVLSQKSDGTVFFEGKMRITFGQ